MPFNNTLCIDLTIFIWVFLAIQILGKNIVIRVRNYSFSTAVFVVVVNFIHKIFKSNCRYYNNDNWKKAPCKYIRIKYNLAYTDKSLWHK